MCNQEVKDVTHFILKCKILDPIRIPYLAEIHEIILNNTNISFHELETITEMQIIMDSTQVGADSIWMQEQKSKIETWLSKTE